MKTPKITQEKTHIKTHEELLMEVYLAIAGDARRLGVYPETKTVMEVFWSGQTTLSLYHRVIGALESRK